MKYNLEKEIKQQMKYCEGNEEETSVIFEYPDPAQTEFVLEDESVLLEDRLHLMCYRAFRLYLEYNAQFHTLIKSLFEMTNNAKKPGNHMMEMHFLDAGEERISITKEDPDWAYAIAVFSIFDSKYLNLRFCVKFHLDENGEMQKTCFLEQYHKDGIRILGDVAEIDGKYRTEYLSQPKWTERLYLPNGAEWERV